MFSLLYATIRDDRNTAPLKNTLKEVVAYGIQLFGFNLELWKLHTAKDYITFALSIAGGLVLLILTTKRWSKGRNDESATQRVAKKLRRFGGRRSALLPEGVFPQGRGFANLLFVSTRGVFAVRCIGWGYRAAGSLRAREWRVGDAKEERFIPNPYAQATLASEAISAQLSEKGLNVPVEPLVVFADPFQNTPRFFLEGGSHTIGFAELKSWYKGLPADVLDRETVKNVAQTFSSRA